MNIIWELKIQNKFLPRVEQYSTFKGLINLETISFVTLKVLFSRMKLKLILLIHSSTKKEPV